MTFNNKINIPNPPQFPVMEFSDKALICIYGNVDLTEVRKLKPYHEVLKDIPWFLSNHDITKVKEINKMPFMEILERLNSIVETNNLPKKMIPNLKKISLIPRKKIDTRTGDVTAQ